MKTKILAIGIAVTVAAILSFALGYRARIILALGVLVTSYVTNQRIHADIDRIKSWEDPEIKGRPLCEAAVSKELNAIFRNVMVERCVWAYEKGHDDRWEAESK